MPETPRVGIGLDTHPWDEARPLWLGGLRFEKMPGLAGHSDGDAVSHALADALLGAAVLGDVGDHFPDTEPEIAGITGTTLLRRTAELVRAAGYTIASCDLTVIARRPTIATRRAEMRAALADALDLDVSLVSVKATRPEGLGLVGEGVGCLAIALLR